MHFGALIEQLVALGLADDFRAVEALPGAGNHSQVLRFSSSLRGDGLSVLASMASEDLKAFVRALAVYEGTVRGLGSVTAIHQVLPLTKDEDHSLLDWVLSNTTSYWYYSHGAKSFAELSAINATHATRRRESERRESERQRLAEAQKAERATQKLFNAVRRGDVKAVQALLGQGAAADAATPQGQPLIQYAEDRGHAAIAEALRIANGGMRAT